MAKRTQEEIVTAIIEYFKMKRNKHTNSSLADFAKELGFNHDTARSWLDTLYRFQHKCLLIEKGEIGGEFKYIEIDYFSPVDEINQLRNR